ncbi:MAG: hypothetical protein JSV16_04825, partial [Candidatus Hydrogenedentota bacterium]
MSKVLSKAARNEYVWATLILAAALCTAFPDVVFGGRSLLTSPYMAGVMPQGPYGYPHRPLLERIDGFPRYDAGSSAWLTEPNAVLTHSLYASGQLPLWNPYVGAGQPLAADLFSGVFYPLKFILYVWPCPMTWDLFYLLRLLVAGVLGYAYMRQIRVSRLGSLAAGMVFMLNGYFLGFLNMPHLNVEVLIPALLLSSEKILGGKKRSGTILGIVAIACCMLGGNPEAAFFAVMLMSCYYFWRVFRPMKGEHRSAFWLAETREYLSVVIPGLALSAFLIIPFLEFVSLGSHAHAKTVGYTVNYRPFTIVLSFIPEFFGRTGVVWLRNVPMRATAFGVVPLLVALGGFGSERKKRGFCYFFAVVFVLYLLKAYGAPIINWIGYLPFFNQSFVNKYGFPLAMFGVATAAGIGVENIQLRGQTRWLAALLALLGLFLMISFYYLYFSTLDAGKVSNVLAAGTTKQDALQYITIMAIPPAALSISILCLML